MKIEKLSETKIRVILKENDFENETINFEELLFRANKPNGLLLEILNKAKKEVDFNTDGYKLLIDAYIQSDDTLTFTITKFLENSKNIILSAKNSNDNKCNYNVNNFLTFDDFCDFCTFVGNIHINLKDLLKNAILYYYNNTYYLIIEGFNSNSEGLQHLCHALSEFSNNVDSSNNFQSKLEEYGKIVIKDNAIINGIKYFCKK